MALILFCVLISFVLVITEMIWTVSQLTAAYPAAIQPMLDYFSGMLPIFLIKFCIYLGIVLLVSGVMSHRLAGPIYKFEKSAQIIASGDITHRIFLRKDDYLMELQEEFNKMLASIHSKIKRDRAHAAEAADKIDSLLAKSSDTDMNVELIKLKDRIQGITREFKI